MIFKSLHESLVKKKINKSLELLNESDKDQTKSYKTLLAVSLILCSLLRLITFIKLVNKIGLKEKDLKLDYFPRK